MIRGSPRCCSPPLPENSDRDPAIHRLSNIPTFFGKSRLEGADLDKRGQREFDIAARDGGNHDFTMSIGDLTFDDRPQPAAPAEK